MTTELTVLLETLMQTFIKQSELQEAESPVKMAKLKALETGIHLAIADINVGFEATTTLTKTIKEKKLRQPQMYKLKKECCAMLANCYQNTRKKSTEVQLCQEAGIVAEPDTAVKMFKQVLTKLVDTKWKKLHRLMVYWHNARNLCVRWRSLKFAGFKFGEDRLDASFYDVLNTQKTYEELWTAVKFLLTLFHGQAAVERGFSVNKEALAPNLKEDILKAIHLVHDTISAEHIEIIEFVITDNLLTSCSYANNRYKII